MLKILIDDIITTLPIAGWRPASGDAEDYIAFCPHYNEWGRDSFDEMLKETRLSGLAMDSETAFVENSGRISYIRAREDARAFQITYEGKVMKKQELALEMLG